MRIVYGLLTLIGTVLPINAFIQHFQEQGMGIGLFISELWANHVTTGFTLDLLISSAVLWCFAGVWLKKRKSLHLLPLFVGLNLCIGLSCAFPAFCWWVHNKE